MEVPAFDYEGLIRGLEESVRGNLAEGLLLSGGLDTSILAYLASKWRKLSCFTVVLHGAPAPDVYYAKLIASRLKLKHYVHYFGDRELEEAIPAVVRIMKCFDPMEIRNSAAIYVAMKVAREQGIFTLMTGDGCDELLGGYSFLFGLTEDQLDLALSKLWANMRFSSVHIAKELGMQVKLPYLAPPFRALAMGLDVSLKVRSERGQVWGKWILRKAFENILPEEIVWRVKAPIEIGTGTTILPQLFNSRISDFEFDEKKRKYLNKDRVVIRDKEHLFYYEVYRDLIGVPYARVSNAKVCPGCNSSVEQGASFCRTCGAYPI